jgi:Mg2+-importing ATPase
LLGLLAVALPYLPAGRVFGFVPLPWPVLAAVLAITLLYLVVSESTKRAFFRFLRL